jgi:hypothetical protein
MEVPSFSDLEEHEMAEAFEELLKYQNFLADNKIFILPSQPRRSGYVFNFIKRFKNDDHFLKSIYGVYIRRQYYYSREVWEAISLIDTPKKNLLNQEIQKLKFTNNLRKFLDQFNSPEKAKEIGLTKLPEKKEKELIKKRNFGVLSETTIDPIAHAILSKYLKCKKDYPELLSIFPSYIYKIIRGDVLVSDPCNKFWAFRIWMKEASSFSEPSKDIALDMSEAILATLGDIGNCDIDKCQYFNSPDAPAWDSTPEIYTNHRSTLYSLINLIYIRKYLANSEIFMENDKNALIKKIDETIENVTNYINHEKNNIFKNPYMIALFIRYVLAKLECSGEDQNNIIAETLILFQEKESEFHENLKRKSKRYKIKNLIWGDNIIKKMITTSVSFIIAIVAINEFTKSVAGMSIIDFIKSLLNK